MNLSMIRGNTFRRGFRFRDANEDVSTNVASVKWTAGVGETIYITKTLTGPDEDSVYWLFLSQEETRSVREGFSYEVEVTTLSGDIMTMATGEIEVSSGNNVDA